MALSRTLNTPDRQSVDKAAPEDQVVIALPTEPSFPYDVPTRAREAYIYGGDSALTEINDKALIRVRNITAADNEPDRFLPFAVASGGIDTPASGTALFIAISGCKSQPETWNAFWAPSFSYPVRLDPSQTAMFGNAATLNLPPEIRTSTAGMVWNFEITHLGWNEPGLSREFKLDVWRDGDEANKTTNTLGGYPCDAENAPLRILIGNPEGMHNPYYADLVHPTRATVESVTITLGRNVPITALEFGNESTRVVSGGLIIPNHGFAEGNDWVYPMPDDHFLVTGGGGTKTFSFVAGDGDTDNNKFTIFTGGSSFYWDINYGPLPESGTWSVRVQVADAYGHSFQRVWSVVRVLQ